MTELFSVDRAARALGTPVSAVEIIEPLQAGANQVARLDVRFLDLPDRLRAIGKAGRGAAVTGLRRERWFLQDMAAMFDSGAPTLLGADDDGDAVLLIMEDLAVAGYALVGTAVSEAQLHGAIDAAAAVHAQFWNAIPEAYAHGAPPSVTRCAQALPVAQIAAHARDAHEAAARLSLAADDRAVLDELLALAPARFAERAARGHLTLIHADYHFFGNVLFTGDDPKPRVIDWSELKPGLGPHDIAYCVTPLPADDRVARDLAMLRRYWEQLRAHGVTDYAWELCRWDHRLSLIHNAFQSLFQGSAHWLRHSLAAIELHDARATLRG